LKKLTIGVDLDETLWPILPRWIASLNNRYDLSVAVNDITDYDITKFFPSLTEEQVFDPLNDDNFWADIEAKSDGMYFVTKQLAYGHAIRIVSSSFYKHMPAKFTRFFECFPMFNWHDVVITSDKKALKLDLLIDDCFDNLGGKYCRMLLSKPYNLKYDAESHGIIRVSDLYHAHEMVKNITSDGMAPTL